MAETTPLSEIKRRSADCRVAKLPYVYFVLDGDSVAIPTLRCGAQWWDSATIDDIRRVAVH